MRTASPSPRNKTIHTSIAAGKKFLARCAAPSGPVTDIGLITDRTINGDFFTIAPLLPREFADLIIADPPYNMDKIYGARRFCRMDKESYARYTRSWLALVLPLLRRQGSLYVCCDWESSLIIGSVLGEFVHIRNRITWQREKGRGARKNWKNGCEDIWFATKSNKYTFNLDAVKQRRRVIAPYRANGSPKDWTEGEDGRFRDTCPSNFWDDITVPFWSMAENTRHPAQKPEKLLAKLILASTNRGDMVFDPFLGSGSTSVAAKKLGRRYAGIELDEQYCVWAEERLAAAEKERQIQGFSDGVFWERNSQR